MSRRNRHRLSGRAAQAAGETGPAGIDVRCKSCGWDPPPFAMERHGRRQPDGTWSLVCPADGTAIVEGIVYQGTDTGRGLIVPPR